ncbi:unnamed protein product [Moneuplotes crassus]|uniref:NAD(+) kinase n=1 Tax=Euplotes crassus TaxID=5936 RepID=A0AAD1XK45_EUPCR|nr:unnamed protein product [Moneuplotes crassus]
MFKYTKVLLIVNPFHKESHPVFLQTLIALQSKGLKCFLEKPVLAKLLDPASFGSYEETEHIDIDAIEPLITTREEVELAIAFGGDGTILHFSKLYYNSAFPAPDLLAFNFGSLGYLCSFEVEDVSCVLRYIFKWKFDKIKQEKLVEGPEGICIARMKRQRLAINLLKAEGSMFELQSFHFEGGKSLEACTAEFNALNEINLTSRTALENVKLEVAINGKYLTTYEGTGLVFSTPTGSTSYNLSLHGSIIHNDVECIGMIAICNTASISMKPLILPADIEITVKNVSDDPEAISQGICDGSLIFKFNPGDTVCISGSKSYIPQLMKTRRDPTKDWMLRLKEKLSLFEY